MAASALALLTAAPALAAPVAPASIPDASPDAPDGKTPTSRETVTITGAVLSDAPASVATVTGEEIAVTTHVMNAEDALRYLPNILVRKRHVGDTQAPITTRTSGVGASARSLIYVDGVLVSALIGNNNNNASPKWGMVSPEETASVSVLYGPFSAAYPGNSIGAVVEIRSRMPEKFEASGALVGSVQSFKEYATKDEFGAWQARGEIGDKIGPLSFSLSATHTDSDSQPLTYVTANRPSATSSAGAPLTGAFGAFNRSGAPIVVLGEGGLEEQKQDNLKFKAAWDFGGGLQLAYTVGRFANDTTSHAKTYLRDAAGAPVYSGGPFNIGGYNYASIAASAFSAGVYAFDEEQWSNALSLARTSEALDWRIVATDYDYSKSRQNTPSTALPAAAAGGAGSVTRFDGTGWRTLDAKATWRAGGGHEISFGGHLDRYELQNRRYLLADWTGGALGALASASLGKTETQALWIEDAWRFAPAFKLTLGGRYEHWRAFDGLNFSLTPALNAAQPEEKDTAFSPKATLSWDVAPQWTTRLSLGKAYRFPTVGELYQAITTGATLTVPNPNLKPEDALSSEFAIIRTFAKGELRFSAFSEDIKRALVSQSAPLVAGSSTLFNYVQNVDKVESRGAEIVGRMDDVLIPGLTLSGNVTFVDAKTTKDAAFRAAEGKQLPQVPRWRSTLAATYRPDDKWTFTVAGRHVDRTYATIDNSDTVSHTYQGFEGFLAFDARVSYAFDRHWTLAAGVENFNDADYFLFHPFPQRTATAELNFRY